MSDAMQHNLDRRGKRRLRSGLAASALAAALAVGAALTSASFARNSAPRLELRAEPGEVRCAPGAAVRFRLYLKNAGDASALVSRDWAGNVTLVAATLDGRALAPDKTREYRHEESLGVLLSQRTATLAPGAELRLSPTSDDVSAAPRLVMTEALEGGTSRETDYPLGTPGTLTLHFRYRFGYADTFGEPIVATPTNVTTVTVVIE